MYFDHHEPQPSIHAVSKPIDILRSSSNCSTGATNNQYGYQASNSTERPRPVNRVKPVIIHTPTLNSVSSNSSSSFSQHQTRVQPPSMRITSDESSNKENCNNRMPMIYNIYANPSASNSLRTVPVDALTRTLFNYIAVSPGCSCADYFSDEDVVSESDIFTPTEFRSIGDIIGYANVIKSQRQQTMEQFNSSWSTLRRTLMTNQNTSNQMH